MEAAAEGLISYWGFLAGLYEVMFVFVVLFLLSEQPSKLLNILVVGLYVLAAALRVAGGTRLLLIKELAVILIVFYMRGKIKGGRLAVMAVSVVILGSVVGLLRSSGERSRLLVPGAAVRPHHGVRTQRAHIQYCLPRSGFRLRRRPCAPVGYARVHSPQRPFRAFCASASRKPISMRSVRTMWRSHTDSIRRIR